MNQQAEESTAAVEIVAVEIVPVAFPKDEKTEVATLRGARRKQDSQSGVRSVKREPKPKTKTPENAVWVRVWFAGMWWIVALHTVTPGGRAVVHLTFGDEQMQVCDTWEYR